MPQIYNLGGLVVQTLDYLYVDKIFDESGVYPIMEIKHTADTQYLPQYKHRIPYSVTYRNVETIITKLGTVINVNNINEGA